MCDIKANYRDIVPAALKFIGHDKLAERIAKHEIDLAIASSIFGEVKVCRDLNETIIYAIRSYRAELDVERQHVADYYVDNLQFGLTVPVMAQ